MRYTRLNPDFFTRNREKLQKHVKANSLIILHSNDEMPRNGDLFFPFRQNSDLFYLCGIDQKESVLLLFPDHPEEKMREILFLFKSSKESRMWEGEKFSKKDGRELSGIENVMWTDDFEQILAALMCKAENVYLNLNENPRYFSDVPCRNFRYAEKLKKTFPLHQYERLSPIMKKLRLIKEQEEIDIMQHACDITEKAFYRALRKVKPGIMENQIEAEITHEFINGRANGHAYQPIIASGDNVCILHYTDNNRRCEDGDFLLMDFGAEYANYSADCTRTIPVNGRFSPRQRNCYDAVLRVFRATVEMLKPGITLKELQEKVLKLWEKEHIDMGLYSTEELKKQDPKKPLVKQYFMHGVSHFIGLDTHDLGDKTEKLKPGMIVTCEPGLYIPDERIGIRLENNILITDDEPVDLMENIPMESHEIEKLMSENE